MRNKPAKWTDAPCPRCGAPKRVINPDWMRYRRRAFGVTLREMGKRLDVSVVYLCDIEKSRRHALPYIVAAYEALGGPVDAA